MKPNRSKSNLEISALLGLVAGMRTSAPVVAACDDPQRAWYALFGEFVVDVLPFTPNRTQAGGLFGRFCSATWAALRVAGRQDAPLVQAALVAGTTSLVATNVMFELRKRLGESLHLPDAVLAIAEDACVLRLIMHIRTSWGASACR